MSRLYAKGKAGSILRRLLSLQFSQLNHNSKLNDLFRLLPYLKIIKKLLVNSNCLYIVPMYYFAIFTVLCTLTGRTFLTRLWLLPDSAILLSFDCISPLFVWRSLYSCFTPWNSFSWRSGLLSCPFTIRWHWNIFRNGSFLAFAIQLGCLYKLCCQHFCTLHRKDTVCFLWYRDLILIAFLFIVIISFWE